MRHLPLFALCALVCACSPEPGAEPAERRSVPAIAETGADGGTRAGAGAGAGAGEYAIPSNPERDAYFGDLHVHTANSFDAYVFGTRAGPDDAYRFAKGGALQHAAGFEMQLKAPLDFFAVTDHAFVLGAMAAMADPGHPLSKHPDARTLTDTPTREDRANVFRTMVQFLTPESSRYMEVHHLPTVRSTWAGIVAAANRHNDPGKFTAFIGYEYSSAPERRNLHRNVIFKGSEAPPVPFSRFDSYDPADLWAWMDDLRDRGIEALAIPHNSNGSGGQMFSLVDFSGKPLDENYARLRMRNEPLVEISQVKGTSETHPELSPGDEWAGFEIMPYLVGSDIPSQPSGSYLREAWLNGLKLAERGGFDPFAYGVVAASDSHNASSGGYEEDYWGKIGMLDAERTDRGSVPLSTTGDGEKIYSDQAPLVTFGASGLAGVWAERNTRDAIYAAMRRKETFGTSGTRIKVRFFAGYDLPQIDSAGLIRKAYAGGVPMGATLTARAGAAPEFIVWASRDAHGAPLQRVQVVKGWTAGGEAREQVFDVACSGGLEVDPVTHRCPDNGATVNLDDCSFNNAAGAAELKARWRDPGFDPAEHAFYYVRALENPTCRWSTWDALRAGVEPREGVARVIRERAWSSPIWYLPESEPRPTPALQQRGRGQTGQKERLDLAVEVTGGVIRGVRREGAGVTEPSLEQGSENGIAMHSTGSDAGGPEHSRERQSNPPAVSEFHGIPYAAPPTGRLRWAPPAPVIPWQGIRDAGAPGPICIQRTRVGVAFYDPPEGAALPPQSEDCLTLNVWTAAANPEERRPVMVWIHGGGLQGGSGSEVSGGLLAERGAVAVSFNYRLGRLGFLAHPELTAENPNGVSGNQGFRDQVQALEWVRENISKFGGDPGNVTIFGESAGSYSVSVMQASPLARGLFHRAIGQSGGAFQPMSHRTEDRTYAISGEALGLNFAAALAGTGGDRSLKALRALPPGRILEVAESDRAFNTYEFLPTVDGEVLEEEVIAVFQSGRQADVPVLVGSTADEGTAILGHFTRFMGSGMSGFDTFATAMLPEVAGEVAGLYPAATDAQATKSWQNLFTDLTFTYQMRAWARSMQSLESDAWLYWFTMPPPVPDSERYGAFHGSSQTYLFGDFKRFNALPTENDHKFVDDLIHTWVRFARSGNPNGGNLPEWPAFTAENEAYMELGPAFRTGHRLRMAEMEMIAKAWAVRRAANAGAGHH